MLILFCISCKISKKSLDSEITKTFIKEVVLNKPASITNRYYEYGIRLKDIDDKEAFAEYFSSENFVAGNFYPIMSDSLFTKLFDEQSIKSYKLQLLSEYVWFDQIKELNGKVDIRSYSDNSQEKYKYSNYPIVQVSIPIFSLDRNYAMFISTNRHTANLHMFKKEKKEWKHYTIYNLSFPEIYKSR